MSARFFRPSVRHAILVAAGSLALSGCLFTPGKFVSELAVMKDGSFAYSYDGEIQMLALSKLAEMGSQQTETFEPSACFDDEFEQIECSEEELAQQRADWDAAAEEREAKKVREAEQMKALLGGIDPSSPEAAQELAERLRRQKGWESVDYLGDGLFDVDFAISGRLDHDFAFPIVEKLPIANLFVTVVLRDGAQARIDAPGFGSQDGGNPMQGMMSGMSGLMQMRANAQDAEDGTAPPRLVVPDGTFTIVTDGRILANNTDEGPATHARGQALVWQISPRTTAAPTALIAFD